MIHRLIKKDVPILSVKEYRLRNGKDQISNPNKFHKELNDVLNKYNADLSMSNKEAVYFDSFIYLPEKQTVNSATNIKINQTKRTKIDYIDRLPDKELKECLYSLKKQHNLKQGELKEITKKVNIMYKSVQEEENCINELIKTLEETTKQVVNNKQIQKYIKDIHNNTDKLIDCLLIDNPDALDAESKQEILNKISLLETYIDDFRGQF